MTCVLKACTDPIMNIADPLYRLATGDKNKVQQLEKLILATMRTATAAALFFMIIPFNHFLGHHDNLGGSLAFASQFLIHPYAASLFNAFINGGPLVMKVIDIFASRQLILTRNDLGKFARTIAFCHLGHHLRQSHYYSCVDRQYREWSLKLANWYYTSSDLKV